MLIKNSFVVTTLFFVCHGMAWAEASAPGDAVQFSPWQSASLFEQRLRSLPPSHYPAAIEAKALLGDGVAFRVRVKTVPGEGFRYQFVYGVSAKALALYEKRYTEMGFVLFYQQSVQLQGGVAYQAVWLFENHALK